MSADEHELRLVGQVVREQAEPSLLDLFAERRRPAYQGGPAGKVAASSGVARGRQAQRLVIAKRTHRHPCPAGQLPDSHAQTLNPHPTVWVNPPRAKRKP